MATVDGGGAKVSLVPGGLAGKIKRRDGDWDTLRLNAAFLPEVPKSG
jgi:hypothetical protein